MQKPSKSHTPPKKSWWERFKAGWAQFWEELPEAAWGEPDNAWWESGDDSNDD